MLADWEILDLIESQNMIDPAVLTPMSIVDGKKVISYGVSSYGYDARLAPEYRVFTNINNAIIDPKNFSSSVYVEKEGPMCVIPPMSFILARTVERFRIPRNVCALCVGKSTYARTGIFLNTTPLEPEWEGEVTLEILNGTQLPAIVYANEGICQILFDRGVQCMVSYSDRSGKYQYQRGITLPKV